MTLMSYLKKFTYLILAIGVSSANAGSFEDFFLAIHNDNTVVLSGLFQRGFDPNTVNEKGQPGLTVAMQERALKAAALLLQQPGVKIDALNQAGESALMMASQYGSEDSVKLLLDRGADPNRRNQRELRAVDFAKLAGRDQLAARLQKLQR